MSADFWFIATIIFTALYAAIGTGFALNAWSQLHWCYGKAFAGTCALLTFLFWPVTPVVVWLFDDEEED